MTRRLSDLKEKRRQLVAARDAAEDKFDSQMLAESEGRTAALKALKEKHEAELESGGARFEAQKARLRDKCRRRQQMVERAYSATRKTILGGLREDLEAHQKELNATKERLVDEQRSKAVPAAERQTRFMDDVATLKTGASELRDDIEQLAVDLSVRIDPEGEHAAPEVRSDDDLEAAAAGAGESLEDTAEGLQAFRKSIWSVAARDAYIGVAYFLAILVHGGLVFLALHMGYGLVGAWVAGASLLVTGIAIHLLRSSARKRSASVMQGLHTDVTRAIAQLGFL
ncbi:MAG: AAA family ATPase, partial [Planctomycetota bacterium]